MLQYLVGVTAGIVSIILDAIIPIVFKQGDIDIFSYLLPLSFVFFIISCIYFTLFQRNSFNKLYHQLFGSSMNVYIYFYGVLRYIKYILFAFGSLNVNPGMYNALVSFEVFIYSIYCNIESNTLPDMLEIGGYGLVILFLSFIVYSFVQEKKNASSKKIFLYATFTIMVAMAIDFVDTSYFTKIDKDPFEDIVLSSVVMFVISIFVVGFRCVFINGYLKTFTSMFDPSHLLYLIIVVIIICQYTPALLEFTLFDYLDPTTIMIIYTCQSVLGVILDRFYYGVKYSYLLFGYFVGLIFGSSSIIKGSTLKTKTTDYSMFKYIRNNRIFDGISTRAMLDKGKQYNNMRDN